MQPEGDGTRPGGADDRRRPEQPDTHAAGAEPPEAPGADPAGTGERPGDVPGSAVARRTGDGRAAGGREAGAGGDHPLPGGALEPYPRHAPVPAQHRRTAAPLPPLAEAADPPAGPGPGPLPPAREAGAEAGREGAFAPPGAGTAGSPPPGGPARAVVGQAEADASGNPLAGLPLLHRAVAAVVAGVVALAVAVHLGMVFLHVAPLNTFSKEHADAVNDYVYPEYEQNWKLFAPNPLQQNIDVQVRARIHAADGTSGAAATTGWTDLSAEDGAAIRHNPIPSHSNQNELRRAWEVYTGAHTEQGAPVGRNGTLSERYLRRVVMARMGSRWARHGAVEEIQVRSMTTSIQPPPGSGEKVDGKPVYRTLAWWPITSADLPEGATAK